MVICKECDGCRPSTVQQLVDKRADKLVAAPTAAELKEYDAEKLLALVNDLFAERVKLLALPIPEEPKEEEPSQVCNASMPVVCEHCHL